MIDEHFILEQIKFDKMNIQTMMDRLPHSESKGEYRGIAAAMKILQKEIHNNKVLLEHKVWAADRMVKLPLFEVEPSPLEYLDEFEEMDSFFGDLGDDE